MEQVAELLWAAEPGERRLFTQPPALPPQRLARIRAFIADPFARLQMALPLAAAADPAACDLRPGPVRQTGARIVRMFAGILAARSWQRPIHLALQTAWAPRRPLAAEAIRQAVVLSADHELNISAFVARCAASAAASPYEVVAAALAALKGSRHGGASERVAALFAETATPRRARAVIAHRLRRGEGLPGFGHPLYPAGDPRAARLLQLAEASGNQQQCRLVRALSEAGSELLGDLPNLDFGLTALARTYALPESAPLLLFALGRTVGWIAHALEQYASGESMRPRARYIGIAPA
jgi:citrate synthase